MNELIQDEKWIELTGASTGKKQCEILNKNGVRFVERADGRPALSWEAYNRQMAAKLPEVPRKNEPNLRAV